MSPKHLESAPGTVGLYCLAWPKWKEEAKAKRESHTARWNLSLNANGAYCLECQRKLSKKQAAPGFPLGPSKSKAPSFDSQSIVANWTDFSWHVAASLHLASAFTCLRGLKPCKRCENFSEAVLVVGNLTSARIASTPAGLKPLGMWFLSVSARSPISWPKSHVTALDEQARIRTEKDREAA